MRKSAKEKMLNKLDRFRETNSSIDRFAYVNCKSDYLKLRSRKELEYKQLNINKLNNVKNNSDWWKLAKSLKTNEFKIGSNLNCLITFMGIFLLYFLKIVFVFQFFGACHWL